MTFIVTHRRSTYAVDAASEDEARELFGSYARRHQLELHLDRRAPEIVRLSQHIDTQVLEIPSGLADTLIRATEAMERLPRTRKVLAAKARQVRE